MSAAVKWSGSWLIVALLVGVGVYGLADLVANSVAGAVAATAAVALLALLLCNRRKVEDALRRLKGVPVIGAALRRIGALRKLKAALGKLEAALGKLGGVRVIGTALRVIGALLIGLLVLLGVDVLVNLFFKIPCLDDARLPIAFGLLLAFAVFGLTVRWYLKGSGWTSCISLAVAAAMALIVIIVFPYGYGELKAERDPIVPASLPVPSKLDLLIVGDGRPHLPLPDIPKTPSLEEFEVTYSVGYADGARVSWTLINAEKPREALRALAEGRSRVAKARVPRIRNDADSALLLLVDGTDPIVANPALLPDRPQLAGQVERWSAVAADAAPAETPTYALVQTARAERLSRWKGFSSAGTVVSVQSLESETATDAAVRLAVASPTADADFSLAMRYRPILLFDGSEPVPRPLSISALFGERRVELCRDEGGTGTDCGTGPITSFRELENGGTHLRLKLQKSPELRRLAESELARYKAEATAEAPADLGAPPEGTPPPGAESSEVALGSGSTIYVHPVTDRADGREMLYLDYWWYLPDNPVELGHGALCGAGLVIAEVTCPSHQSDWEGLTVVVDRTGEEPRIVAVQYAQHNGVVRYPWRMLHSFWIRDSTTMNAVADIDGGAERPLAFVAVGTHATYPDACPKCSQMVNSRLQEGSHLGGLPWVGNYTGSCGRSGCLQMLPTRRAGREPALWNAFEGTWGEHRCILTYYCSSSTPPTAPGRQRRYAHPAHYSGNGVRVGNRWRYRPLTEG